MKKDKNKKSTFTAISKAISGAGNKRDLNKVQNMLGKYDGPYAKFMQLVNRYNNKNHKIRNIHKTK